MPLLMDGPAQYDKAHVHERKSGILHPGTEKAVWVAPGRRRALGRRRGWPSILVALRAPSMPWPPARDIVKELKELKELKGLKRLKRLKRLNELGREARNQHSRRTLT
jgi:hypothetical protein